MINNPLYEGHTFAHIPSQMSDAIPRVVSERSGEDSFCAVFNRFGEACYCLDDVGAAEGLGCDKVAEGKAVQD